MAVRPRRLAVLVAIAILLASLAGLAYRYDRPPVTPGAWLAAAGLEPRFESVGGRRLRYVRAGEGPPVVLVHGFGSSLYTWKDVIPALTPAHDVVALDLPGFGESDQPADLSLTDLPATVVGLLDRLKIARAALVGNSLGGATAALVAGAHPDRVAALVLIDAAGFVEPGEGPPLVRLAVSPLGSVLARLPFKRLLVERALRQVFWDDAHVTDERVAEYLAPALRAGAFTSIRSLGRSARGRPAAIREVLPRVRAPTLVIWGRDDAWIPVAHSARFAAAIPGARTLVIDDCGHLPQEERPEEVGRELREFLGGIDWGLPVGDGGAPPSTSARG